MNSTNRMIKVNFRNIITKEFPAGISLKEVSQSFQNYFAFPILVAKVDNDIVELSETISKKCDVEFFDRSSTLGNGVYGRSLQFLLIAAIKRLFGETTEILV